MCRLAPRDPSSIANQGSDDSLAVMLLRVGLEDAISGRLGRETRWPSAMEAVIRPESRTGSRVSQPTDGARLTEARG